jgi:hypothetical protein
MAACAPTAPPNELAFSELAGRVVGPAQSCVPAYPTTNLRPLREATLIYGAGRTIYVNRLRAPCPGLTSTATLPLDVHGSQYCSGDHFRTVEIGSVIPGAVCLLGEWLPYRQR